MHVDNYTLITLAQRLNIKYITLIRLWSTVDIARINGREVIFFAFFEIKLITGFNVEFSGDAKIRTFCTKVLKGFIIKYCKFSKNLIKKEPFIKLVCCRESISDIKFFCFITCFITLESFILARSWVKKKNKVRLNITTYQFNLGRN